MVQAGLSRGSEYIARRAEDFVQNLTNNSDTTVLAVPAVSATGKYWGDCCGRT